MRHKFKKLFLLLSIFISAFSIAQNVNCNWVMHTTGSCDEVGNAITTDRLGNVYVTGHFMGTMDVDPGTNTFNLITSLWGGAVFILKLDSLGNFVWAKQFNADDSYSIVVDSLSNLYVTGAFAGTTDFDPGIGTYTLTAFNDFHDNFVYYDVYISKFDASGNFIWAKQFGGPSHDYSRSITLDKHGNIYTTGDFQSIVDFDPGLGTYTIEATSCDGFVSKLDPSGNFLWAQKLGGQNCDGGSGIKADKSGNVYVTGIFQDTCDFDPGPGVVPLIASAYYDSFVVKLDSAGGLLWAKRVGGVGQWENSWGRSIALDNTGGVIVTGYFTGSGDFDPNAGTSILTSAGNTDAYILKLDTTGNFLWAKSMGGTWDEMPQSIGVDDQGNIYTTGFFQLDADFDPGPAVYSFTTFGISGIQDVFVSKLDTYGNFVWAKQMGGPLQDIAYGISVTPSGIIYTTGRFDGTSDFDPNSGVYNLASNQNDLFVHRMSDYGSPVNSVGIKENRESFRDAIIYPNPSSGILNIEIDESDTYTSLSISSALGQIFYSLKSLKAEEKLDISFLTPGIYFVTLQSKYESKIFKLIKE